MKIYGSMHCPDCVDCCKAYDAAGIKYEFINITGGMPALKEFLHIRDNSALFDPVREKQGVGIPCIVLEDGTTTLDWESLLPKTE
ncbi:MAG: glutaredoxin [Clostridia bacterium]|nr:glutaredoxin [Clostridia bacterium]